MSSDPGCGCGSSCTPSDATFADNDYRKAIPADKKLDPAWVRSLYERGQKQTYTTGESTFIGMPVGGIGCGMVYLGGDGRLWMWDVFNQQYERGMMGRGTDGQTYLEPFEPIQPFAQGFALQVDAGNQKQTRTLDRDGFANVTFDGRWPIGMVSYVDDHCPVQVKLEAFSPMIPLDFENSTYPATVMRYTLTNTSAAAADASIAGWIDNPVGLYSGCADDTARTNTIHTTDHGTIMTCTAQAPADRPDWGSFALASVGPANTAHASGDRKNPFEPGEAQASAPHGQPLLGALGQSVRLEPGASATISFVLTWHFPNLRVKAMDTDQPIGWWYATRFKDAPAVAEHLIANLDALYEQTRLWVDTWYDSTLPYWLLDRAMANTTTLATTVCYLFADGRFYAWEGINCCAGTCTHVWHYAQAPGRLFPQVERNLRQRVDFGMGQHENGAIAQRMWIDKKNHVADDGHCGRILGMYREHQMSENDALLRKLWPNVKRAIEFEFTRDADGDGILEGAQANTLDAHWYGQISFTSSLHLAAMRAGQAMAREMGDDQLADRCAAVAEAGATNILKLYNGEYFYQIEDPDHLDKVGIGTGCYIDQIFGQTWAYWTGLGVLFDREKQLNALRSLWKYNFVPDIGPFREQFTEGRWYAQAGDAGLIMCAWPREPVDPVKKKHWQYQYFNECMSGFEYQAAAHMVYEGHDQPDLLEKGLAVTRAIHDRYHATRRNPYNEIECSDHYARAMASYGVFQAVCGFNCHGPSGYLEFAPRLTPGDFKAPFTCATGWGTFTQCRAGDRQIVTLTPRWGHVNLAILAVDRLDGIGGTSVEMKLGDQLIEAGVQADGRTARITPTKPIDLQTDQTLVVQLG